MAPSPVIQAIIDLSAGACGMLQYCNFNILCMYVLWKCGSGGLVVKASGLSLSPLSC